MENKCEHCYCIREEPTNQSGIASIGSKVPHRVCCMCGNRQAIGFTSQSNQSY